MIDRFELLTGGITQVYRCMEKIKKSCMSSLGLRGAHVMCLYYLEKAARGLTLAELCEKCSGDKAGISRIMADLEKKDLIMYQGAGEGKKYRARARLTEAGRAMSGQVRDMILTATEQGSCGISESDRETFYRILFLIRDNLQRYCDGLE